MKNKFEFKCARGEKLETFVIEDIDKEEAKNKSLIGSAYGVGLFHCVYIGDRHCENFLKRVKYYYIDNEAPNLKDYRKIEPRGVCVEFYTEKQ